jgi:hypothetical protein
MPSSFLSCLIFFSVPLPTVTSAQKADPQQAAFHSTQGGKAMNARNYTTALAEYVVAYTLDPAPERLVDVGRALEALGHRTGAQKVFQRVVATGRRGPAVDRARQRLAALGGTGGGQARSSAQLSLTVMPPGAEIWVDGKKRGVSPMGALALNQGSHQIEIRLAGYKTHQENIQMGVRPIAKVVTLMPGTGVRTVGTPTPAAASTQSITIIGIPNGASVTLNGRPVPVAGPTATATVPSGRYALVVKHPSMPPFTKTLDIGPGENPSIQVAVRSTPAVAVSPPSSPSGSLAGGWYAVRIGSSGSHQLHTGASINLKGAGQSPSGVMVLRSQKPIPSWKRAACKNADMAIWDTRYNVTLDGDSKTPKLIGSGGQIIKCNCAGICNSSDSIDLPLIVAPDKNAMVTKTMIFLRHTGGRIPQNSYKTALVMANLTGNWSVQYGSPASVQTGQLQLKTTGRGVNGRLVLHSSATIPRWQRRMCRNASTFTVNHHFTVAGEAKGAFLNVEFNHEKKTDCTCVKACQSARQSLSTDTLQLTLDGKYLVGAGLLLSRQ